VLWNRKISPAVWRCSKKYQKGEHLELIDLQEKEVFQKHGRGMANLVDEPYLQINQASLEPGQEVPRHQASSHVTLTAIRGEGNLHYRQ
jgi:quercetin dioxygenase-like cupin family protein